MQSKRNCLNPFVGNKSLETEKKLFLIIFQLFFFFFFCSQFGEDECTQNYIFYYKHIFSC